MSNNPYQFAVVGGGIVGLATAKALLEKYPGSSLLLIEKEDSLAYHQTGHNSGVIHSGLYYKPGSFKARLSVEGAREMKEFCQTHQVACRITGKVVVATGPQEIPLLEQLHQRGLANGVAGLELIGPDHLKELEPHAKGVKALKVPGTGIVDYKEVCLKMAELIQKSGGTLQTNTRLFSATRQDNLWILKTNQGDFKAKYLVNCGGLHSDRVARTCGLSPKVKIIPFRGEYYSLKPEAESLVKNLIYPVPNPLFPFLGVHFTNMIHGGVEAGPNAVLAYKREGYGKFSFNLRDALETLTYPGFWIMAFKYGGDGLHEIYRSLFKSAFVKALQKLVPDIEGKDLVTGGSGVRAQALDTGGALLDDFKFLEAENVLHVLNAPSPAATASLPIGREIAQKVSLT